MTREELYNSDRGERLEFELLSDDYLVPITNDGFEAMVEKAASYYNIPVDDGIRSMACGFIHHIPHNEDKVNILELAKAIRKVVSNNMTFEIDQKCKAKEIQRKASLELNRKESEETLSIVLEEK